MMTRHIFIKLILAFFIGYSGLIHADGATWKVTTIPMPEAGTNGLETLLVWPDSPGKHPLALISHGSPRDANQRAGMTALAYLPIAFQFARRGFSVAVVLRRGYGASGGGWAENYNNCNSTDYPKAAKEAVKDLHTAIQYLSTLPQFDTDRMIAVGVSAGGFATVALTADAPPKGLVAAINFAGGRGSKANNEVCQLDALVSTFGQFGKTSRIPMLWVYAKNDHFFNPAIAQQFLNAFKSNGGNVTFIQAPEFGTDGHLLFSKDGIPIWTPIVDDFLKKQNLVLRKNLPPAPKAAKLNPPAQLSVKDRTAFILYLASPPHKAFAVDVKGAYGWSSNRESTDEAKKLAIDNCQKHSDGQCEIYSIDGR